MRSRHWVIGTVLALAVAGVLATAPSAAAEPLAAARAPSATATARADGILRTGDAYMGWSTTAQAGGRLPAPAGSTLSVRAVAVSATTSTPRGVDVSSRNRNVNWRALWNGGFRFAYIKATEGNYYINSTYFPQQYNGSYYAGMIRGAYHFANPSVSTGAAQAQYFVQHGGGWSADGKTLPGALDIEYNPYGSICYGKTQPQMRAWISSFLSRYKALTGRDAVIYTNYDWWNRCTGNTTQFNRTNPLWVARYATVPGTLPGRWPYFTFWQYSSTPFDQSQFNGTYSRLQVLARGR